MHEPITRPDERAVCQADGASSADPAALERAWQTADAAGQTEPAAVSQQIRCALFASSPRITSGEIPTELLLALVREEAAGWTPEVALKHVAEISLETDRARAIEALAPHLAPALLPAALALVARLTGSEAKRDAVCGLVARLPPDLLPALLESALTIQTPSDRAWALERLLPHLPAEMAARAAQDAWAAVKETGNPYTVALYYGRLQHYLPPQIRPQCLTETFELLEASAEEDTRARGIDLLAAHLTPQLSAAALRCARSLTEPGCRVLALMALLPRLPQDSQAQVAEEARSALRPPSSRYGLRQAKVLFELLPYLPPDQQPAVLDEVFDYAKHGLGWAISMGKDSFYLRLVLERLRPEQCAELVARMLAGYRNWPDADFRGRSAARNLPGIVDCVPAEELPAVLELALTLKYDENDQRDVLVAYAPRLGPELQAAVLTGIAQMRAPRLQGEVLAALAPHLAPQHLPAAVALARSLPILDEDFSPRVEALVALISCLASEQRDEVLAEALAVARDLPVTGRWRCPRATALEALAALVPAALREDLLIEAGQALSQMPNSAWRGPLPTELASTLPPAQRQAALQDTVAAAQTHQDGDAVAAHLAALAPHLPVALRRAVLHAVATFLMNQPDLYTLPRCWEVIPPGLAADMPVEVLAAAVAETPTHPGAPRSRHSGADELRGLAPYLPAELMPQALAAVQALPDVHWSGSPRSEALEALAPYLPGALVEQAFQIALALPLREAFSTPRLSAVIALFPRLAPHQQEEVLASVRQFPDKSDQGYILSYLAPHLPAGPRTDVSAEALAGLRQIEDAWRHLDGLIRLLPCLTPDLRQQALDDAWAAVKNLPDDGHQRPLQDKLLELAHHLPVAQRDELLRDQLADICEMEERSGGGYTLSTLPEQLPPDLPQALLADALAAAYRLQDETYRVRAVSGLVAHVEVDSRAEPLAAALAAARATAAPPLAALFFARLLPALPVEDQSSVLREALAAVCADAAPLTSRDQAEAEKVRQEALQALAPVWAQWADRDRQAAYMPWPSLLRSLASKPRRRLLADLRSLLPVFLALGGPDTPNQVAEALIEVSQQWP